ncbi:hypothetical protein HDU76_011554, partial [Blyttiomyces sp. JEL0837]
MPSKKKSASAKAAAAAAAAPVETPIETPEASRPTTAAAPTEQQQQQPGPSSIPPTTNAAALAAAAAALLKKPQQPPIDPAIAKTKVKRAPLLDTQDRLMPNVSTALLEIFARFDDDNDGALSRAELENFAI